MLSDSPWTKMIKLVALSLCGVGTCPGITLDDYSRLKNTAMMVFFIVKVSLPLCSFEDIESPRAGFQGSPSAGSSVAKPRGHYTLCLCFFLLVSLSLSLSLQLRIWNFHFNTF